MASESDASLRKERDALREQIERLKDRIEDLEDEVAVLEDKLRPEPSLRWEDVEASLDSDEKGPPKRASR